MNVSTQYLLQMRLEFTFITLIHLNELKRETKKSFVVLNI